MQQGTVIDMNTDLAMEAAAVGLEETLWRPDLVAYTVTMMQSAPLWKPDVHSSGKSGVRYNAIQAGSNNVPNSIHPYPKLATGCTIEAVSA